MPLLTREYTDIDLDFTRHPVTGDIAKKKGVNAIAASMYNLFNTSNYERLFNPDLGTNMKQYLFEPLDSLTSLQIKDAVMLAINNFETRVQLEGVLVQPNTEENGYKVFITFFMVNDPDPITISVFLERVR